jgi:hypothetical protein
MKLERTMVHFRGVNCPTARRGRQEPHGEETFMLQQTLQISKAKMRAVYFMS